MKINVFAFFVLLLTTSSIFPQEWETDFDTAKTKAVQENKNIILVFQGSDWCAPCIKLNTEIWTTNVFKTYAKDHYIMLLADFPRKKGNALSTAQQIKNNALAEKYNQQGYFPFVVVLNKAGKVLGETGYQKTTPSEYIKKIDSYLK